MKKLIILLMLVAVVGFRSYAQEKYARTLNLGLGVGYYGHVGHTIPVVHVNYELAVVKSFTLAPFISFYNYRNDYYSGSANRYYTYHETVIPVGVKGTYYFDDLLNAQSKWDFYLAGSLGFAVINSRWDSDYNGDKNVFRGSSPLFLDIHIGSEYHFNENLGAFLDLSSGVSTIGFSIH